MIKPGPAIHNKRTTHKLPDERKVCISKKAVKVLAIVGDFVMVQINENIPYVAPVKEIEQ